MKITKLKCYHTLKLIMYSTAFNKFKTTSTAPIKSEKHKLIIKVINFNDIVLESPLNSPIF